MERLLQVTNGRPVIVITELPYQTNKAAFVADIARLVDEQKLVGAPAAAHSNLNASARPCECSKIGV